MWTTLSLLLSHTMFNLHGKELPRKSTSTSKSNRKAEHCELHRLLDTYCLQSSWEIRSRTNHVSYGLPHLSSPTAARRMGSLPILPPLTTQDQYSSAAGLARQCQKKNNSCSCFSWRANNRHSAFHGSNRAANNPSIFHQTQAVTEVLPKLGKRQGKS